MVRIHTTQEATVLRTLLVVAVAMLTSFALALPVQAETTHECHSLVETLRADTLTASSLSAKDQAGLSTKATAAADKLSIGKVGGALQKLGDYSRTLELLHAAAKPKVSELDYGLLSADVHAAITCVENTIASG